jgi:retron-type reverse transcriptase
VQPAVVTILSQIYEEDLVGFFYRFRPGRRSHQALNAALSVALTRRHVNAMLDYDIRAFFDNLSHEWVVRCARGYLQHRRPSFASLVSHLERWTLAQGAHKVSGKNVRGIAVGVTNRQGLQKMVRSFLAATSLLPLSRLQDRVLVGWRHAVR